MAKASPLNTVTMLDNRFLPLHITPYQLDSANITK